MLGFELGRRVSPAYAAWNVSIQSRVSKMANVLAQLTAIRMTGLAPIVSENAQALRVEEMKYSKKYRYLTSIVKASG